jgi:hypothetical protein
MAKWQEQEDGSEKFQHNSVSTKIGEEKSEKGFYLYPRRQREGTWMTSKCQINELESKSQEGGAQARV